MVQHEIEAVDTRQLVALHVTAEDVGEVMGHRFLRDRAPDHGHELGAAGQDADVGVVALVAAAAPGQGLQGHGDGGRLGHEGLRPVGGDGRQRRQVQGLAGGYVHWDVHRDAHRNARRGLLSLFPAGLIV